MPLVKPNLVIDFHAHQLERQVFEASTNQTVFTGFGATPTNAPRPGAQQLLSRIFEPETVLEDMDNRGIDMSVVTSSTVLQGTSWADAHTDLRLCKLSNEQSAKWQGKYPNRFIGSMVLPLQDCALAIPELRYAHATLGLKVANVSSSYNGVYMGDPIYHPFWEVINALGIVTWIHPEGTRDPWFQRYALWNSLGQSIEEAKCMASLIYEGVMTKFPKLNIVMAHGGGYFPHYMGRMDRNTANRPDTVRNMNGESPSSFLKRFYYDSCVYDPQVFKVLLERVGADRIVMGSDYPVGEKDPIAWLRSCGVEAAALELIAGRNAAKILGLDEFNRNY
jgi:aminocarboxymuconate-semialdehyde decarboxylase